MLRFEPNESDAKSSSDRLADEELERRIDASVELHILAEVHADIDSSVIPCRFLGANPSRADRDC
jgi:hypothetical protein